MSDRFKFRVWNEKHGRYIQDNEYPIGGDYSLSMTQYGYVEVIGLGDYQEGSNTTHSWGCVKNLREYIGECVVEQCTGLKDRNGKLIYEGDIIKIPDNWDEYGFMAGEKREVYFLAGGFRLKPKYNKNDRGCWLEDTDDFEIIGNIHTDKNLLNFS